MEPAPEALRLQYPGSRQYDAGNEPVANLRLVVGGSRLDLLAVQVPAFGRRDHEGGGAGPVRLGYLDRAGDSERTRDRFDRGERFRHAVALKMSAGNGDAQAFGAARQLIR